MIVATKVTVGSYVLLSNAHEWHPSEEGLVKRVSAGPHGVTVYDVIMVDGSETTVTDFEVSYTRTAAGGVWQHVDL